MRRFMILGWALVIVAPSLSVGADQVFDGLAKQVPSDANVLVLIDSEHVRKSPFYKQEKLDQADAGQEGGGQVFLGPQVSQALIASKIRGFRESQIDWELALLSAKTTPSLTNISLSYGGTLDQLGKKEYVSLPTGAMVISSTAKTIAVLSPADRPRANKIMSLGLNAKSAALSTYLTEVYQSRVPGADAVIAIDLEDLISPAQITRYLADSQTFKDKTSEALVAGKLLSSLRGLTLRIKLQKTAHAELTIDFGGSTTGVSLWAKELLAEILNNIGAEIEDLSKWSFQPGDRKLVFEGEISMRGLRQVFSLVSSPTDIPPEFDPKAVLTPEQETQRTAKATLNRFRATQKLIDDLRSPANTKDFGSGENGMWFDKYAKKIECLPSLHVDKDMLAYCDDVVMRLRIQATRFRMVGIKAGQYSHNSNYVWYYFGNWYGSVYGINRVQSDSTMVRRFEQAGAAEDKFAQFEAINKETVEIRRAMTEKYMTEF